MSAAIGGSVALLVSMTGLTFGVPPGWQPIAALLYFVALIGIAVAPTLRHHTVVALGIALCGSMLWAWSLIHVLLAGFIANPMTQRAEPVVMTLILCWSVTGVLLIGAIGWAATKGSRRSTRSGRRLMYVGLVGAGIAFVQLAWVASLHL